MGIYSPCIISSLYLTILCCCETYIKISLAYSSGGFSRAAEITGFY